MPAIMIDKELLLRELDDLVKVNQDAKTKGDALEAAVKAEAAAKLKGEADVQAAQQAADATNTEAEQARAKAEVDSKVADELLTKQIAHLKALVDGHNDDEDPTPDAEPSPK
jgi:membrane protein involved in colicin uptake